MPIDTPLNVISIDDADDPRLRSYTALKERTLAAEMGLFVCEGAYSVQRLLTCGIKVASVLVVEHRLDEIAPLIPAGTPVYTATNDVLSSIVGYEFHQGMLACGVKPAPAPVESLLPARTLVVLPEVRNVENLGLIIRAAHALGVDGLLLSDKGCDPFTRRVIRVSMGSVFALPMVRSIDLESDLRRLKAEYAFSLVAAVADEDAQPVNAFRRPVDQGVAVVFGNEPDGLSDAWVDVCDTRVTIPMKQGVDSLNLAVAAGIILHQITVTDATSSEGG